jgi:hypothetical protein
MLANIPKRKQADAWSLETTTAPAPGTGSVAEDTMEYARQVASGKIQDSRLFFFHRQAAESHDLDGFAQDKRRSKRLPLVVGNLVSDGLGSEDNLVVLYDDEGRHPLERAPKPAVARAILEHVSRLLKG